MKNRNTKMFWNSAQWKKDFNLINWERLSLFDEYLEMGKIYHFK